MIVRFLTAGRGVENGCGEQGGAPERANKPVLKWRVTCARPVTLVDRLCHRSSPTIGSGAEPQLLPEIYPRIVLKTQNSKACT